MKGKKKVKEPQEVNAPPNNEPAETHEDVRTAEVSGETEVGSDTNAANEASAEHNAESNPEILDPPLPPDTETLVNQANDRYKRTLAEFDNFRKRTAKEMAARYDDGQRAAAEKLLPIVDNFQRALSASENKEDNFYQGVAMIARQFEGVLTDIGIEPITDETGTNFDHNLHHAVAHVEDESLGQNVIVEVLQKGYKHRDKVLRPSMVKVAN